MTGQSLERGYRTPPMGLPRACQLVPLSLVCQGFPPFRKVWLGLGRLEPLIVNSVCLCSRCQKTVLSGKCLHRMPMLEMSKNSALFIIFIVKLLYLLYYTFYQELLCIYNYWQE